MLKTVGNQSVKSGNQTINDGNLVIGTAGYGVDFSNEEDRVQSICRAVHTKEVIDAYKASAAAQGV